MKRINETKRLDGVTEILHQLFLVATIGGLFLLVPLKSGVSRLERFVESAKEVKESVAVKNPTERKVFKGSF